MYRNTLKHLNLLHMIIKAYLKQLAKLKTENAVKKQNHSASQAISQRDKKKYGQMLAQDLA